MEIFKCMADKNRTKPVFYPNEVGYIETINQLAEYHNKDSSVGGGSHMTKKLILSAIGITLTLSVLLFSVGASASAKPQNPTSAAGSSQAAASGKVLATVNGKNIYLSDFQERLRVYHASAVIQSENAAPNALQSKKSGIVKQTRKTDRQILSELIKVQVIKDECSRQSISVSRAEAKEVLERNYKTFQNLMNNGSDLEKKQARSAWNSYTAIAKTLGVSLDEYTKKYGVDAMQTALTESRYYQHFASGLSQKNLTEEQINSLYDKSVQSLIQKSKITVNDSLLEN
jgi:hypothetical protein